MFMSNIPRRKIYEGMLEFEDGLIEMQILIYSHENFEKFGEKFILTYENIKESYFKILALFIMFLENRKYPLGKEMEVDLNSILVDKKSILKLISKTENLPKEFIKICEDVENNFVKINPINTYDEGKKVFQSLDKFNHIIPELLTIRRDNSQKLMKEKYNK
ncbi:MAG: hypothetical protein KC550_00915 [Nanoarchaeota archaeon]|nr:hypothetical protein [Nanoarchaeota archaeon]